jgi:hypothetical protein
MEAYLEYAQAMADRMPTTMTLPDEFLALFDWMETNSFFMRSAAYPGDLLGLLGTEDQLQSGQVTVILFRVATSEQARENGQAWFGEVITNIEERLVPSLEPAATVPVLPSGSTMKAAGRSYI